MKTLRPDEARLFTKAQIDLLAGRLRDQIGYCEVTVREGECPWEDDLWVTAGLPDCTHMAQIHFSRYIDQDQSRSPGDQWCQSVVNTQPIEQYLDIVLSTISKQEV